MPDYRRNRVPGGTYFFTLALADRRSDLLVREIDALRAAVARTRRLHPFRIDAWVVLPDHLHAVWTLPQALGCGRPPHLKLAFSWASLNGHNSCAGRCSHAAERGCLRVLSLTACGRSATSRIFGNGSCPRGGPPAWQTVRYVCSMSVNNNRMTIMAMFLMRGCATTPIEIAAYLS